MLETITAQKVTSTAVVGSTAAVIRWFDEAGLFPDGLLVAERSSTVNGTVEIERFVAYCDIDVPQARCGDYDHIVRL